MISVVEIKSEMIKMEIWLSCQFSQDLLQINKNNKT